MSYLAASIGGVSERVDEQRYVIMLVIEHGKLYLYFGIKACYLVSGKIGTRIEHHFIRACWQYAVGW